MNTFFDRTPVIVGTGEITQRSKNLNEVLEPLTLMEAALRAAQTDAGVPLLEKLDSLDVIQEFSWPYLDAPTQLAGRIGVHPKRSNYGPVGGETPVMFIHEAALRIWRGESEVAAVTGAEAQYAVAAAQKQRTDLPWSARDPGAKLIRGTDYLNRTAVQLGVASPATVYPLYENAVQQAWGQTPEQGLSESGQVWERCASVAAENPYAWSRDAYDANAITTPTSTNRLIAWPYTVRMVANPLVNQGAAILLTTRGNALRSGIPESRLIYLWCGAAAQEPADYLERDQYTRVHAQDAVLERILQQVGDRGKFSALELYSCFPVVPKMARRTLALPADATLTCTGGLSFFGAPLNNYMSHAAAAMVRRLRGRHEAIGLLYGQGGYLTKHHAVVLSSTPPSSPLLDEDYSVQSAADARRGPIPTLALDYTGPARIETYTVLYGRDGSVQHGIVLARTPLGARLLASVSPDDAQAIALLTSLQNNPIGTNGQVRIGADSIQNWSLAS